MFIARQRLGKHIFRGNEYANKNQVTFVAVFSAWSMQSGSKVEFS
jgi:hypothetical protein